MPHKIVEKEDGSKLHVWRCDCCHSYVDNGDTEALPDGWSLLEVEFGDSPMKVFACPECTAKPDEARKRFAKRMKDDQEKYEI